MTSLAFIAGLLPLMRAQGASALGNRSIGTGAVGGMLTGVLLGIFMVPVLYIMFQYLQEKIRRKPAPEEQDNIIHESELLEVTFNN
jgi:HAE1 family hydrophobic/amphiphilic exporter-1